MQQTRGLQVALTSRGHVTKRGLQVPNANSRGHATKRGLGSLTPTQGATPRCVACPLTPTQGTRNTLGLRVPNPNSSWATLGDCKSLTPTQGATQQSVDCKSLTPTQGATGLTNALLRGLRVPLELGLGTRNPRFVAWPLESLRDPQSTLWRGPLTLGLGTCNPRFVGATLSWG